jgi:alkylated DNA nucleotide flippase Atl1
LSEIPLNKFEKRDLILRLLKEGKTYREICHIAHVSPRDVKPIAKEYERKKRLETNIRIEKKIQTKKPSISSQAFILFKEGKQIDEVKVLLDIPYKLAIGYWRAYLESIRMFEAFEFYQENSYDMPTFLRINTFLKLNNIYGTDIVNVLRTVKDILNLNKTYSNLKIEIEKLKQTKNNYSLNQNTNYKPLLPLGLPKYCYEQYWE